MVRIRRLLMLATGAVAFLLYVWYEAVRYVPTVKRRKRASRA
jgi:hypothetical protein